MLCGSEGTTRYDRRAVTVGSPSHFCPSSAILGGMPDHWAKQIGQAYRVIREMKPGALEDGDIEARIVGENRAGEYVGQVETIAREAVNAFNAEAQYESKNVMSPGTVRPLELRKPVDVPRNSGFVVAHGDEEPLDRFRVERNGARVTLTITTVGRTRAVPIEFWTDWADSEAEARVVGEVGDTSGAFRRETWMVVAQSKADPQEIAIALLKEYLRDLAPPRGRRGPSM
jgi:hypothetical protein